MIFESSVRVDSLEKRLARVEYKLDEVLRHLGLDAAEDPTLAEVRALVREGKQVKAIKAYREITGAGLSEAKKAVDGLSKKAVDGLE